MTYWDEKEYWAAASTINCVWLFQTRTNIKKEDWHTECVFITQKEAEDWGNSRPYDWGEKGVGWRAYGVPCYGLMAKLLSEHVAQFGR